MDTPAFIQISTAGSGQGYNTYVYGLTADGKVYQWCRLNDGWDENNNPKYHYEWVHLVNEAAT